VLISVVMPTLNEAANMGARHAEIARQSGPWEWIVVDGGSTDQTLALVRSLGGRIVQSSPNRGLQLDAGANVARGEILLFLHADTALPAAAFDAIRSAMRAPDVVGGNFALRFDENTFVASLFAWCYATQQRLFGAFYGDSAIFVRHTVYRALGGFGGMPIMEDYAFVRRLQKAGPTVRLAQRVTTSARRYRGRLMRALWIWFSIMVLYHLGVPPQRLARMYRPHRDRQPAAKL